MLNHLLESGAAAPRRGGWALASTAAHATLILAAVALTMREQAPKRVIDYIDLVYTPPSLPAPRPVEHTSAPAAPSAPARMTIEYDIPRMEFPTITPVGIPEPSTRPSDVTAEIVGTGVFGPPGPARPADGVHTGSTVDRAVVPHRGNPRPDYPAAMRAASVEGSVLVQFVVDTIGRVEPHSIAIVRTTHPQFGEAVRRWLGRTRYSPAEIAGARVRQLVQQEVGFSLQR